jgi:hypothetical protein
MLPRCTEPQTLNLKNNDTYDYINYEDFAERRTKYISPNALYQRTISVSWY